LAQNWNNKNEPGTIVKGIVLTKNYYKIAHDLLALKSSKVYMTFFFQTNTIRVIFENVLALPSFIMAVNGCFCSKASYFTL